MNKTEAEKIYVSLIKEIEKYNTAYYILDNSLVSDEIYDRKMLELRRIEEEYPEIINENSPTKRVGFSDFNSINATTKEKSTFEKVAHAVHMGSLQDVFVEAGVEDFIMRVKETVAEEKFSSKEESLFAVEPKIDGLSASLTYENGVFIQGATRGDGLTGEDVTENLRVVKSVPEIIPFKGKLTVRGEVFMPRESFEKFYEKQKKLGVSDEKLPKNPRNAASGSLRQKNPKITAERDLDIFIFNLQKSEGISFELHSKTIEFLKEQGFNTVDTRIFGNYTDVIGRIKEIGAMRGNLPYDIDGAAVKVNDLKLRGILGSTSKFPKWAVAFKYPPEEKETLLLEIIHSVGRTGKITPVAVFEPVLLAGTTVTKATLHNQDIINKLEVHLGDIITVRKAGDIIPDVISAKRSPLSADSVYVLPETVENAEEIRTLQGLIHFASKDAMDIDSLGEVIIKKLFEIGFVKTPADFYRLNKKELLHAVRKNSKINSENGNKKFKKENSEYKTPSKLMMRIAESKNRGLSRLLFALGIDGIGVRNAKTLAEKYGNIDDLSAAAPDELICVPNIGESLALNICSYLNSEKGKRLINELKELGVKTSEDIADVISSKLAGKKFVITGTLPLSRNEIKELLERNGAEVTASVSKKTNYLLAGEDAGSKLEKAKSLEINVINYDNLLEMLKNSS